MIGNTPLDGDNLNPTARLLLFQLRPDWRRLAFDRKPPEAEALELRGLAQFRRRRSAFGVQRWQGRLTTAGRIHVDAATTAAKLNRPN